MARRSSRLERRRAADLRERLLRGCLRFDPAARNATATLLVNVTNDAWFGRSTARYQHLQISRMRAMETGRPMVRAANDGVSAVIGAQGELIARAPEYEANVMRADVQPRTGLTPYARTGNWPVVCLALVFGLGECILPQAPQAGLKELSMASDLLNFAKSVRSNSASSSPPSRGFADMSLSVARRFGLIAAWSSRSAPVLAESSAAPQGQVENAAAPAVAQAQVPSSPATVGTLNGRMLPDFATLVEQVGPAVVNVSVVEKAHRAANQSSSEEAEDPIQEFFRRFGIPPPDQRGGDADDIPQRQGEGSGFIVSADGYILTNAHVVADADEVTVRMTDRREYPAKVIGIDRRTDVAVIKIEGKNLPVVRIGDPAKLRPGEWVLAIGSPFTFENSVTAGIVSATGRSMPGEDGLVPFIQTDVAVNPGNSGGPLFNLNGEVVGINSQIYSRSGGYMGCRSRSRSTWPTTCASSW